jgi:hypothetical protein
MIDKRSDSIDLAISDAVRIATQVVTPEKSNG